MSVTAIYQCSEITRICRELRARRAELLGAVRRLPLDVLRVSDARVIREALMQAADHDAAQIESFGRRV